MRSQRTILGIRWHDFVRNTEVVDRTGLPCVRDVIAGRRNSLFGHVVRLDDHTPAHRALSQVAAARTCSRFGPGWRRRPGRPRHSWIHPADRRRYTLQHSCRMVQGSSSCPLWVDATDLCCLRDLMMMMMMVCLRCEAYDVHVGAVALGHLTYTCRYLSRCELTHCFCITLADDEIAQKFDPSRPTFQGHSRSLEPTRTVRSGFLSCVSMRRIQTAILFYQFCLYVRLSVRCRYCL